MNSTLADLLNGMLVSAALAFAIWLVLRLTPRKSLNAATRYAIWWAVLAVTVALPLYYLRDNRPATPSSSQPSLRLTTTHAQESAPRTQPLILIRSALAPLPSPLPPRLTLIPTFPIAISAGPWPARIVALWLFSAFLMLTRLIASAVLLERRKARAMDAREPLAAGVAHWIATCGGSKRRIRLAISREISVPLVSGPRHPTILLPARLLAQLTARDLEQIGIHEAAHLVRRDDYALLVQRTLEALFVLHPVAYWLSRRIDLEREVACDDYVIAATGDSRPYAACLARVVELSGGIRAVPIAAAAAEDSSHLARRVDMLLDQTRHTGTCLLGLRLAVATACIAALSWGAVQIPGFISFRASAPIAETPPSPPSFLLVAQANPPVPPVPPIPAIPAVPATTATPATSMEPPTVSVPVEVRDPQGRFVTGLDKSAFKIKEDGVAQAITEIAESDERADLYVLVGAEVNPEAALQPFLAERIEIPEAGDVVRVHGFGQLTPDTAPLDAVVPIQRRLHHISRRQVALILTNGNAASERYTASEFETALGKIDMPVYVIDISDPDAARAPDPGHIPPARLSAELASRTGGTYTAVRRQQDIPDLLAKIVIAVRNTYFLGYTPQNPARDGGYRSLQVEIEAPRGLPPLTAHSRPGYTALPQ